MPATQRIPRTAAWALALLLLAMSPLAMAQDNEGGGLAEFGSIFGDAQIYYEKTEVVLDGESGALAGLTLSGDVRIRSEKLDLDCDFLIYDVPKDRIITTGRTKHPVKLRQEKTMVSSCQRLEIYPNEGKFILTGNAMVRSTAPGGGAPFTTRANEITLVKQKDGKLKILIESGGQFKFGDGPVTNSKPAEIIVDDPANFTGTGDGDTTPSQEPVSRVAEPTPEPLNKPTSRKMPSVAE